MIKIAIMGHGVVGSGVVEVFNKNKDNIIKKSGQEMEIGYILDLREFPELDYANKFTKNFEDILRDSDVKVVVETMGGINPAYDFVKACLLAGKSVVSSNKELVAVKGAELITIAHEMNVNFLFEASVGGGIPILRPITQCLAANEISEIYGILNGTTNYILTKMIHESVAFEDALKTAQELGYAEKDPTADVEGHDACRKICILSALAFGKHVYPAQVYTEGITKIDLADVAYCENNNSVIKLIGKTIHNEKDDTVYTTVYPAAINLHSQLATVDDVYNAVMIRGDAIGDVVFYGRGAGKLPTASAVVADIIDCAKHLDTRKLVNWAEGDEDYVRNYKEEVLSFYLRVEADDEVSFKAKVKELLGEVKFLSRENAPKNELAFVTSEIAEKDFDILVEKIDVKVLSKIRLLDI